MGSCHKTVKVEGFPDSFVGIGVELRMDGDLPVVVRTLPHGPAEQAHLVAGDHILAIGDRKTEGQGLGAVVMQLRGKPGSRAVLTVRRAEQVLSVVVRREAMRKEATDYGPRSAAEGH